MQPTPSEQIAFIVARLREGVRRGELRGTSARRQALRQCLRLIDNEEGMLCHAVREDLRKAGMETALTELTMARNDALLALRELDNWGGGCDGKAIAERVWPEGVLAIDYCAIVREPLGVVLILPAWNYPLQFLLMGLIGGIAAGNSVLLKPSELAPYTAQRMAELIPKYLPTEICGVVNGGVETAKNLLENHRFDHILFTGSSSVGKQVLTAAAKHLTPVTLELGGKAPCIVDCGVDVEVAAKRVMWGRVINAGQTCVAPDYLLVHHSIKLRFIEALRRARSRMLGENPIDSSDYARMVNDRHYRRVKELMKWGTIVVGGECNDDERFIAPTVLDNVDPNSPLMREEIFGPLLPILTYHESSEVIEFIRARDKPLAVYIFSLNKAFVEEVIYRTSSGAVVVNDVVMHAAVEKLPFGGVGASGFGAYHGRHSFELFSHRKAVMKRWAGLEFLNSGRYMPYTATKGKFMFFLMSKWDWGRSWGSLAKLLTLVLYGCVATSSAYGIYCFAKL